MINNPELIKQVIDNIKKLSKEDLDKVMKEADKWYNKEVTDINIGNIDKDIERCKELIKDKHKEWIGMTNQKAIANVLNNYEKIQNEVKELENYINPSKARISYFDTKKRAIVVIEGFIPKQKIKDKIEEYNEEVQEYVEYWRKDPRQLKKETCVSYYKKIALEELLKESEDK